MPHDGVIPEDEQALQRIITESVKDGRRKKLYAGLKTYDEYVRACRPVEDPETHAIAATLWRELKIEDRLLNAFWSVESFKGVKGDLRANVRRELVLFYAQQDKHELAEQYMKDIPKYRSRNNIEQQIVDATADAKRIMYAKNYWRALEVAASADKLLKLVPRVINQDSQDNSWWQFVIAVQTRDFQSANRAARWLTEGRLIQGYDVPAETKRSRRKVVDTYLRAAELPVGRRFAQRRLIQAALLYDKYS